MILNPGEVFVPLLDNSLIIWNHFLRKEVMTKRFIFVLQIKATTAGWKKQQNDSPEVSGDQSQTAGFVQRRCMHRLWFIIVKLSCGTLFWCFLLNGLKCVVLPWGMIHHWVATKARLPNVWPIGAAGRICLPNVPLVSAVHSSLHWF